MVNQGRTPMPTYIDDTFEFEYNPKGYVSRLDHFHLAECARQRMIENVFDIERWRGERRSFYTAIRMMKADDVVFMD